MGLILLNGTAYSGCDEPPCVYSEEEREIGVWTDGKPLYQKTIDVGVLIKDTSWHDVACGISNVDKFVDIFGIAFGEDENFYTLPNYRPGRSEGIITNCYFDSNSVPQFSYINNLLTNAYAWITIKYTKTTDTPGSGKWASNGVLAKHYSLQEQVIGTWIDGKPIYEITFDFYDDIDWNISYSVWNGTGKYIQNCGRILKATCSSNSGVYTEVMAYSDSDHIKVQTPRNGDTTQCRYLTIQYTKTTD